MTHSSVSFLQWDYFLFPKEFPYKGKPLISAVCIQVRDIEKSQLERKLVSNSF